MSNIISTWSPLDRVLPTVPSNVDYALYYVTDKGSYKSLNLNFNVGDWLVYIKKNGVANWYKSNGIVTFNTSSTLNAPDPGFYTKVRLDNQGNIVAADYIDEDDLPAHKHYLSDITDQDNLVNLIKETLGSMIANHDDSSVKLAYDKKTKTISAEVNYDGITIDQNEFGELEAIGGGEGSSSSGGNHSGTITLEQVEDLTSKLEALEQAITENQVIINEGSGLSAESLPGGTVVSVNVDGSSIRINSFGQLEVNPDYGVSAEGEITGSGGCAVHDHTADQITDLKDFVVNIINQYKTINVTDLPIDGTTIVINNNGTLSAIATAVAPHNHVMDDITDLNKAKADTWASDQPLQGDTTVDYKKGIIDLSNFTIGYSIEKISEAIKEISTRLEETENMVGKVVPAEPLHADAAKLSLNYVDERKVYDIFTQENIVAGAKAIITTTPIYPYNEGLVGVYIDDTPVGTLSLTSHMVPGTNSEGIKVVDIRDSYEDTLSFQGFYKSVILSYTTDGLEEGPHTIRFDHVVNDKRYSTETITFNVYKEINPTVNFRELHNVASNKYVSGVFVYQGDGVVSGVAQINNAYDSRYLPIGNVTLNSEISEEVLFSEDAGGGFATCDFKFTITQEDVDKNFLIKVRNYKGDVAATATIHIPNVIFDSTEDFEELYRYLPVTNSEEAFTEIPKYNGEFAKYITETNVPSIEAVIRDNIARLDITDYSARGLGPNYSNNAAENGYFWINFVFESDFRNNIYLDLVDGEGNTYSRNKDGTLNDICIYVGQSETLVPEVWVNGNVPFDGCSSAKGIDFSGLDLFRSDNTRRYVTFGQRPSISSGYIFVKLGIAAKKTLDCKTLVKSILESLDE